MPEHFLPVTQVLLAMLGVYANSGFTSAIQTSVSMDLLFYNNCKLGHYLRERLDLFY